MKIPVHPTAFNPCQRRIRETLAQAGVDRKGADFIITPGEYQEVRVEFHRRLGPKFCLRVILGTTFIVLPDSDWSRRFFDIFTADPCDQQLIFNLNAALIWAKRNLAKKLVRINVRGLKVSRPTWQGITAFRGSPNVPFVTASAFSEIPQMRD